MDKVSLKDREILRELAMRKAQFAHSKRNEDIIKMWNAQAKGERSDYCSFVVFKLSKRGG